MKLFRFGPLGKERPGVIIAQARLDVSRFGEDYNERFFESDGLARLEKWLGANLENCPVVPPDARLGSCISRPSKIICVGLNYVRHAHETNAPIPKEPILFFKSTTALCGPYDNVVIPKRSFKTDWEVELAVVIGKVARHVEERRALDFVAGYALHNDYSERAFQLERGGQWVKGKSADTFAPLGPLLVTADEIEDPNNLSLWLTVNNERLQDSTTSDMIFPVPVLISYISQFMTLLPGDVISTGTPSGVGLGLKPPRFVRPGDVIELGIDRLGTQRQIAVSYEEQPA
ncbi:fumarylacetoacetate hydrolase family protein [Chryseolinea soli]|uniref:FAA hydrolase family protein n=1 Tax=Chryseolinea soli TaxID=2321403 RepID=A0A385SQY3_9BACT|nr:fumarylacetoacetate hydrolase family protein [Chryseolinea soli]AYB31940.1 FAA hydrolase family protein [Chryseolinea soli]